MLDPNSYEDFILDQKKLEENLPYENFLSARSYESVERRLKTAYDNGKREDGRESHESRKIYIKLGALVEARGSCYMEMGKTKVLCGVTGPQEIPFVQLSGYTELGSIVCNYESFPPLPSDKAFGDAIKRALEPSFCRNEFPNLEITVSVLVLDGSGSALAGAITAASLALVHARLPIYDILTSVSLGVQGDVLFFDPTQKEEDLCMTPNNNVTNDNYGLVTVSYMTTADQIAHFYQSGHMDIKCLLNLTEVGIKRCEDIYALCQQHLMNEVKLSLNQISETEKVEDSMKTLSTT